MRYTLKIFYACAVLCGEEHVTWCVFEACVEADDYTKCQGMNLVDFLSMTTKGKCELTGFFFN